MIMISDFETNELIFAKDNGNFGNNELRKKIRSYEFMGISFDR